MSKLSTFRRAVAKASRPRVEDFASPSVSDEESTAAVPIDPDNPPLTHEQLSNFKRVPKSKWIRRRLGMTQEQFAEQFLVPLGTLRDWEQHRSEPDAPAKAYLSAISGAPDLVLEALKRDREQVAEARARREAPVKGSDHPR